MSANPDGRDLHGVLDQLGSARLPAEVWADVEHALRALTVGLRTRRPDEIEEATTSLANLAFQAKVRRRLGGTERHAPAVAPTKNTPVLPIAGLICGSVLLLLGGSLGGWVLLTATALLALFVFGVAMAGTKRSMQRLAVKNSAAPAEPLVSIPAAVDALRHEAALLDTTGN